MRRNIFISILLICLISTNIFAANKQDDDKVYVTTVDYKIIQEMIYNTSIGSLNVSVIGHSSLRFWYNDKIIHVDPYSKIADYSRLPKADLILLTHEHADHLDKEAIDLIRKDSTHFILTDVCKEQLGYGEVIKNGEETVFDLVKIEAVPAYNIIHARPDGEFYHPKGRGNGYILTFGDFRVYIAGDTENIPEMESLKGTIDIAFLPKNIPYTMTDDMFVDAAKKVQPKYLYPYHFSEFNKEKIEKELDGLNINLVVCPMSNK